MARNPRPNKNRPRKNPGCNRRSRGQRLRRLLEKEAKMKLCNLQQIRNESFQDSSQNVSNIDSVPTTSREITNPCEESKRSCDLFQKTVIIDSFSVIKTGILDTSEKNQELNFQKDSQYATTMPTTSRKILNSHRENKRTILNSHEESKRTESNFSQNPIIIDTFSVIKTEILDSSEKNQELNFQDDSQCATATNMPTIDSFRTSQVVPNIKVEPESEAPFLPQTNTESASTVKENIGFNHEVHYNKVIKKIIPSITSRTVCGCFDNIAKIKDLCESYLKLVQQDNTSKLCLCNTDNYSILENMKPAEQLMKKLSSLLNPDFRKVTCCMNDIDNLAGFKI